MIIEQLQIRKDHLGERMLEYSEFLILNSKNDPKGKILEEKYYSAKRSRDSVILKINEIYSAERLRKKIKTKVMAVKEKRVITSLTYENAQRRFSKNFNRYFGRGMERML